MKQKKQLYLLILLVLVCLVLLLTGTYAAYTNTAYAKRVVTTGIDNSAVPFSSNYLYEHNGGSTYIRHVITVPKNGSTPVDLAICNYPFKDSTRVSNSDITYKLTIEVVNKSGVDTGKTPPAITPSSDSYELKGGQISINTHTVSFTHEQVTTFKDCLVRITATSTKGLSTSKTLAAEFELISASEMTSEWRGQFTDEENPEDLSAFNYEVYGTAEGTVTITWDGNVTLSKWSRDDLAPGSTGNSISFDVGGEGKPTSYLMQFYRLQGRADTNGWPEILVTFDESSNSSTS